MKQVLMKGTGKIRKKRWTRRPMIFSDLGERQRCISGTTNEADRWNQGCLINVLFC